MFVEHPCILDRRMSYNRVYLGGDDTHIAQVIRNEFGFNTKGETKDSMSRDHLSISTVSVDAARSVWNTMRPSSCFSISDPNKSQFHMPTHHFFLSVIVYLPLFFNRSVRQVGNHSKPPETVNISETLINSYSSSTPRSAEQTKSFSNLHRFYCHHVH